MPASGQARPASTNSGTRCTRTTPAIRVVAPAGRQSTPIQGASSSSTGSVQSAARTRQVRVNGSRLCRAAYATVSPAATTTRNRARPAEWLGSTSPAKRPTPAAARTTMLLPPGTSGQNRPNNGSRTGAGTIVEPGWPGWIGGGVGGGPGGVGSVGVVGTGASWWIGADGRAGGPKGRSTRSSAPDVPAGGSANLMAPPWRVATQRAMARPSPVPPVAAPSAGSASVPNRSNARSRSAGATPAPRRPRPAPIGRADLARDPHPPALRAVPDRVVEHVGEQLAQPRGVGLHLERLRGRRRRTAPPGRWAPDRPPPRRRRRRPAPAEPQRRHARLDAGELEEIADQGADPLGLVDRAAEVRRVGRADAVRRGSPSVAVSAASGVRSSWETVATRLRCSRSTVASSAAIWLNARANSPISSEESARTRPPDSRRGPSGGSPRSSPAAARSCRRRGAG